MICRYSVEEEEKYIYVHPSLSQVRVFNYNTLERQHCFDAHSDYVRSIAAHPTQPFILTSSGELSSVILRART